MSIEVENLAMRACFYEHYGKQAERIRCFCGWTAYPVTNASTWRLAQTAEESLATHFEHKGGIKKHYADYYYGVTDGSRID